MEGGNERGDLRRALPALKRYTALAEDGLEVTGLPLCHFSPPYVVLPPLHLALRAPLPICSANQAHSFLRGVERECGLMGLGLAQGNTCIIHDGTEGLAGAGLALLTAEGIAGEATASAACMHGHLKDQHKVRGLFWTNKTLSFKLENGF